MKSIARIANNGDGEQNKNITWSNMRSYHITIATLVPPYNTRWIGRFCDWFRTDATCDLGKVRSYVKAQFEDQSPIRLIEPFLMHTPRDAFYALKVPDRIINRDHDFAVFGIEEKQNGKSIIDFALSNETLSAIEANCANRENIQIFDLAFSNAEQCHPEITVSNGREILSGLTFHAPYHALVGIGTIERHTSMSVDRYEEITGDDIVMLRARKSYYDPLLHDYWSEQMSFIDFLERDRRRFGQAQFNAGLASSK